ncbi:aminotransferase class V-fold PLP-dependent enzyme [Hyphococcus flavus]|uniref:Aminotransferase class V-fold PLP-dependent enzyme n=1 Tax=Hyphococcus flavus TaxID=1866326 RepID=A0AAF0CEF5_9PROT|nr:aminotransferase class V-fold PLP-dependent enzyme [Hyphococcus flavus]WDI31181.1 aminotransferase class V-fold PLP-dependent enzyme [Hyphococcus flavus]
MSVIAPSRRSFFGLSAGAAGLMAAARATEKPIPEVRGADPVTLAQDENFWSTVRSQYYVTKAVTNLENGYWGIMAAPVMRAYQAHTERVNFDNTIYARSDLYGDLDAVNERLAGFLGVGQDEILLTRGASEALQILIGGYNKLKPGDAVLYADLDYSAMKSAMTWLESRRGAEVIKINLPEPATKASIIDAYRQAFERHPNLRLMLLTHVNNLTGLIHPVREITTLAKERGIDVILDSAHALGQVDFNLNNLGADFIGFNLHKWIGAPIGCGLIYIKKDRINDIDRFMNEPGAGDDIRTRAHTGTLNFAAHLAIPDALDFHEIVGGSTAKEARLRYLRNLWVQAARDIPGVDILTPDDPDMVAALTSFRIKGRKTTEENNTIVDELKEKHGIFTVRRTGPAAGDCVRVTPALYNTPEEMALLPKALTALS